MSFQTAESMHAVYGKTSLGRQALNQRTENLTSRQRSVLIMMDGNRSLEMLTVLIPGQELRETVPYLLQHGYIETIAASDQASASRGFEEYGSYGAYTSQGAYASYASQPGMSSAGLRLTQDTGKLCEVRDFMIKTLQLYLGRDGDHLAERVGHAEDAAQMMGLVGQWHMALHGSRHGNRFASLYLDQIKARLIEPQ